MIVRAHSDDWKCNGDVIDEIRHLHIPDGASVVDLTYGEGGMWTRWRPANLVAHDRKLDGVSYLALPEVDETYDVAVFDPPYKFAGTAACGEMDIRYGLDQGYRPVTAILDDMRAGLTSARRIVRRRTGVVLLKCQDQAVSSRNVWQTDILTEHAYSLGMRKVERYDCPWWGRPQPKGKRQVNAWERGSTLLVFKRGRA